ncbi:sensor histidine kinase [Corynebacterium callunae]|uniref:sensor histidine kinase n=1 Tax=Corynebacterium callunae TaxID=1721 RepID=UPI0039819882
MRFATRILVIQVLTIALVVSVCAGITAALTMDQLKTEAEHTALAISRSIASNPEVRAEVAADTFTGADPSPAELAAGNLQEFAQATADSTGALFVVITDGNGIRLAHPDPSRLGEIVSTSFAAAMRGEETIAWETGTLGDSARAKVPVFAPGSTTPVGEVSVGFERESVYSRLPAILLSMLVISLLALLIGTIVAFMLRRHWERITLGLQPEELITLVQNHTAVLEGIDEGVLALNRDGSIGVHNQQAQDILGAGPMRGRTLKDLGLDDDTLDAIFKAQRPEAVVHNGRILYVASHPVIRGEQTLGHVITIRDRTDIIELSERLDSVRNMTHALRAQRHEFANRIHTATGLIDAGRFGEAADFLGEISKNGGQSHPLIGAAHLNEAFLSSFLNTASITASERGVSLKVSADTLVLGEVAAAEDVATILGNLIANAVTAAVAGEEPRWVEITLLDDRDTLAITIADSGPGIPAGVDVFRQGANADSATDNVEVHGHGIGLKLSRALARSHGGELWVIDHGSTAGAVFGVQLPGVMEEK